jgi:hypothetical protein
MKKDQTTSWHEMLKAKMEADGEVFDERVCTLDESQLKAVFDAGYGGPEGQAFTAWGKTWVYFPITYDGSEWVGHAPRDPCDISMYHQGGY